MKYLLLILLVVYMSFTVHAQQVMITDFTGKPVSASKGDFEAEGSPFFPEKEYKKSTVFLKNRTFIRDLPVRIDLQDRKLFYLNDRNEELLSVMPVQKVIFEDGIIFETGYPAVGKIPEDAFFEVADTGKLRLLKYYEISFTDSKGYNSNTVVRQYFRRELFFVFANGQLTALSGIDAVLSVMADKRNLVQQFIKEQDLRFKKPKDYLAVVKYYNQQ